MSEIGRDPAASKFLRGLTIGALLGAVIAGSSIWSRRASAGERGKRTRPDGDRPTPESGTPSI